MTRYSSESRKGILSDQSRINEMEYFQSIYPQNLKILQRYVEEECDRMEFDGSMMYDEYPDRLGLRLMCRRIYDRAKDQEENPGEWLRDLIEVMSYQELLRRRSEHRNIRKRLYY